MTNSWEERLAEIQNCVHEWNNFSGMRQRCVKCLATRDVVYRGEKKDLDWKSKQALKEVRKELLAIRKWLAEPLPNTIDSRLKQRIRQRRIKELLAAIKWIRGH